MAGYIKGITIEFGADVSGLNAGLKKAQSTINKTQAELKQINRALKFNPGNTTLLKQKFDLLKLSVTQTEEKLRQLKAMQQKMDAAGVDKASAQYRELEREIVKTESQLKNAEAELKRFGSVGKQQILAVGNTMKAAGNKIKSAGRAITTTISVWGMAAIYAGKKLIDMSQKQAEAELKLESVYKKSMKATKGAAEATKEYASELQKQGVIGDEVLLSGAAVLAQYAETPEAVNGALPALANYLAKTKGLDATQEDAVAAAKLFGKALQGNTGALEKQVGKLTDAQKEILKTGTEEEKAALLADLMAKKTGDINKELAKTDAGKIQQAKNALGDMGEEIGAVLLPAVADLVSWLQDNLMPKLQQFIDFMKQHPNIAKFALALAGIVAVAGPLLMFLGSLIGVMGSLVTVTTALDIALAPIAGIVLLIVAAIAAAIAIGVLLYKNWDKIKAKAKAVWTAIKTAIMKVVNAIKERVTANFNTLKTTISNIWKAVKTKVVDTVTGIKTSVVDKFNKIKNKAGEIWTRIKEKITEPIKKAKETVKGIIEKIKSFFPLSIGKLLKNIKLPHFKLKWSSKDFGKLGSIKYPTGFSVSWYKKAMQQPYMFSNPTLFGAGEAGDEVLYGRQALMRDIAQAVGGGGSIVMNVYGSDNMSVTELANAVERKLIQAQKRRTEAWA